MIDPRTVPIFLRQTTVPPLDAAQHLTLEGVQRFIAERAVLRAYELDRFITTVFGECKALGLNPDVMLGMSNLETDRWRSPRWKDNLNPAGSARPAAVSWGRASRTVGRRHSRWGCI